MAYYGDVKPQKARKNYTWEVFPTEEKAKAFAREKMAEYSPFYRKYHPVRVTPAPRDWKNGGFIVFYYY